MRAQGSRPPERPNAPLHLLPPPSPSQQRPSCCPRSRPLRATRSRCTLAQVPRQKLAGVPPLLALTRRAGRRRPHAPLASPTCAGSAAQQTRSYYSRHINITEFYDTGEAASPEGLLRSASQPRDCGSTPAPCVPRRARRPHRPPLVSPRRAAAGTQEAIVEMSLWDGACRLARARLVEVFGGQTGGRARAWQGPPAAPGRAVIAPSPPRSPCCHAPPRLLPTSAAAGQKAINAFRVVACEPQARGAMGSQVQGQPARMRARHACRRPRARPAPAHPSCSAARGVPGHDGSHG